MDPWKKIETQNGLPLYINEITNEKLWDHPKFSDIRQQLDECNYVRYSSYRVALKFRVMQQALSMDQVPLTVIAGVFERHKLGANECGLHLDCFDLEAILFDIFFACNKQNQTNIDVDMCTELMLHLLLKVYDREKTGKVQVLSSKILLGILSNRTLFDLYKFLFELSADHNNCITRLKLQILLKKITEIVNFLHEDANFGQHLITSSTESCFYDSPGLVGITESTFISWLDNSASILSWLPILSRIKSAETVLHNNVCSSCNIKPFVGLCYKCLKCSHYIQCQRCFFVGRTTNSHKLSHSMREHCDEINGVGRNYIFMKKMLAILTCSSNKRKNMTTVHTNRLGTENEMFTTDSQIGGTLKDVSSISSPLSQLQLVIRQLEQQNRELNAIILSGNRNTEEIKMYLKSHRTQVSTQINKLKVLKEYLKLPSSTSLPFENNQGKTIHSTPMVPMGRPIFQKLDVGVLSPIAQDNENVYSSFQPNITSHCKTYSENGNNFNRTTDTEDKTTTLQYSLGDISTWIGGNPSKSEDFFSERPCGNRVVQTDLDDALAKLQQILANNFTLDESLGSYDNGQLKYAVSEVEGMLTSFIDTVETSRASSVQPNHPILS
ncbi:hypothetical protein WA026_011774 [Henosepilachna vigintioctopunctata]|uniref:Dystrophin n=1 Tax=Henosepilachna vigintioctopunctata TaxID=420089 RepID=A0AAW1UJ18_9CUCU